MRRGSGTPLLLVHGLGSSWRSWDPVLEALSAQREVIAVDLPGFGGSAPLTGEVNISTLCDALVAFLEEEGLRDIDLVGSSMGARMVLELARRGVGGSVVALDPGGFWTARERAFVRVTLGVSIKLIRALQPVMPTICGNSVGRTALLAQFSAAPWKLDSGLVLREMRSFAAATSLDSAFDALVEGPGQEGAPAGSGTGPITIGWGRQDRVTLPRQAQRAARRFPGARLQWFDSCGHFPHWDQPEAAARLILSSTGEGMARELSRRCQRRSGS